MCRSLHPEPTSATGRLSGVTRSRTFLLLFACLVALALAGCGDDDGRSTSPTTAPAPASDTFSGRVVRADRDGPSVEIVEVEIVTGADATAAARADGAIGPDEEWELDFYVVEGERRWLDLDPDASVAVYDCTQACEHVAGTLEHVLAGSPYAGEHAIWTFELLDGRAVSVDEVYLP